MAVAAHKSGGAANFIYPKHAGPNCLCQRHRMDAAEPQNRHIYFAGLYNLMRRTTIPHSLRCIFPLLKALPFIRSSAEVSQIWYNKHVYI